MFQRIKVLNSHAALSRLVAECERRAGFLARVQVEEIPSPYRYSPCVPIWRWQGKRIIWIETRHRRYEVFEVPANFLTFKTDEEATDWDTRYRKKA